MLTRPKRVIKVASNTELLSKPHYLRTWLALRSLRIPRRRLLDVISDALVEDDFFAIYPSGAPYVIPDIDEVFGDDPDLRWFSLYLLADLTGQAPKHFSRKIERLRLLDIYMKLKHPALSAHFGK